MLKRTLLTGLALALLSTQACGGDDGKKKSMRDGEGGEGGMAPAAGGSAAGETEPGDAGEPSLGGTGGVPAGGMGGEPVVGGNAGAGGEPYVPEPELLFSVKPGAIGIPTSAVDEAENPYNIIFSSKTGSQDLVDGTNTVKVTGVDLGLRPEDQITAFTIPQPEPAHPLYLFSIADGSEGAGPTRTYLDYYGDSDEQSNLYYSDGAEVTRYRPGDGAPNSDEYGYNGLLATQTSIGLSRGGEAPLDDLTGLMVHDAKQPITELYFTVAVNALGAEGSVLAGVPENERACTVFKSALDGTQSVAFTCAELGLLADDHIDALSVLTEAEGPKVLFSVTTSSLGAPGTAVAGLNEGDYRLGATIFSSTGDGSNDVYLDARKLGLSEYSYDELDGFTMIEAPQPPSVAHAATCQLTPNPLDAALLSIDGVSHIGNGVMVLVGTFDGEGLREIAYDVNTCMELGRQEVLSSFVLEPSLVVLPQAGWSAAKPFEKVAYLTVVDDSNEPTTKVLRRFDAAGGFVSDVPIPDLPLESDVYATIHDAARSRLFVFSDSRDYNLHDRVDVFPLPAANTTELLSDATYGTTLPCAIGDSITGLDAQGNFYLAEPQIQPGTYRVCGFTAGGELLPLPYTWSSEGGGSDGFIVPGGAYYLLGLEGAPSIERGAIVAP